MSVTITLSDELAHRVQEDAARQGMPLEELISRELQNRWPAKSVSEASLLEEINDGFPEDFWERYKFLRAKLDEHTLADADRDEFLKMVEQVERKQNLRLGAIAQLAKLRGASLSETIRALGLEPA